MLIFYFLTKLNSILFILFKDEDVLAQLIYGARYLDIRIGRYPNHEHTFWGNHGPFRIVPLKTVINAVKFFLDKTDEIIIFDVQEFPVGELKKKIYL